jgi:hypothetical protein
VPILLEHSIILVSASGAAVGHINVNPILELLDPQRTSFLL